MNNVPGVTSAAVTSLLPLSGNDSEIPFYVHGRPRPTSQGDMSWALLYVTSPGYLKAMNIPLVRGRYLGPEDMRRGSHVAVVDEVMARTLFPNEDPLGKRLVVADLSGALGPELVVPMEIVGIVGHVSHWGLDRDAKAPVRSEVYLPLSQIPQQFVKDTISSSTYVVRSGVDPLAVLPALGGAVLQGGSDQPIYEVRSMEQVVSRSIADRRFSMLLLGLFAALALVLAALGIYGVISYTVAQRTARDRHPHGARGGANRCTEGCRCPGRAPRGGRPGHRAGCRLRAHPPDGGMLYGVRAGDPLTFAGVAAVLAAVALVAIWLPARRATRVAPVVALRYE